MGATLHELVKAGSVDVEHVKFTSESLVGDIREAAEAAKDTITKRHRTAYDASSEEDGEPGEEDVRSDDDEMPAKKQAKKSTVVPAEASRDEDEDDANE